MSRTNNQRSLLSLTLTLKLIRAVAMPLIKLGMEKGGKILIWLMGRKRLLTTKMIFSISRSSLPELIKLKRRKDRLISKEIICFIYELINYLYFIIFILNIIYFKIQNLHHSFLQFQILLLHILRPRDHPSFFLFNLIFLLQQEVISFMSYQFFVSIFLVVAVKSYYLYLIQLWKLITSLVFCYSKSLNQETHTASPDYLTISLLSTYLISQETQFLRQPHLLLHLQSFQTNYELRVYSETYNHYSSYPIVSGS